MNSVPRIPCFCASYPVKMVSRIPGLCLVSREMNGPLLCLLTDKVTLLRGCGGFIDDDIIALKIKTHDEFYFFEFV